MIFIGYRYFKLNNVISPKVFTNKARSFKSPK